MRINIKNNNAFKNAILLVLLINLTFFFIEFFIAFNIKSVSLFADSIDFLEDIIVNLILLLLIIFDFKKNYRINMIFVFLMLLPGFTALWATWYQIINQNPPNAVQLSTVGLGALLANLSCALILVRFKNYKGSITLAAFLSARNDAIANITIILTGLALIFYRSIWPDIFVGFCIALINCNSALKVYKLSIYEKNKN